METDKAQFKTVATFRDEMSARITAMMLNANGIPAEIFGAESSYPSLSYMGPTEIKLKVNEEDYDAAMELLAASQSDGE